MTARDTEESPGFLNALASGLGGGIGTSAAIIMFIAIINWLLPDVLPAIIRVIDGIGRCLARP